VTEDCPTKTRNSDAVEDSRRVTWAEYLAMEAIADERERLEYSHGGISSRLPLSTSGVTPVLLIYGTVSFCSRLVGRHQFARALAAAL